MSAVDLAAESAVVTVAVWVADLVVVSAAESAESVAELVVVWVVDSAADSVVG